MRLYNTETREKEPVQGDTIYMYTCGPTVYDYAHIGNFRTYIFEDLLKRTLKLIGFKVVQAMNITDVDDKTLKGAIKNGISLLEYTAPFKKAFFEDLEKLNIEKADYYPEATAYIKEMIDMIATLLEKGYAYKGVDGCIYYSIKKFPTYGRLSHLNLGDLKSTGRVCSDEYDKENVSDFVLWKAYDETRDGSIFWDSPYGKGRPGWHIECSAMALKLLKDTIDIHCGGVDNIFPHHENEIAQSEAYTGKPFVKIWAHSCHLIVEGKKMSKSLANFFTLRDLINRGYAGREIRYLLLQTHYRTQLNFTFEGLEAAKASLRRLDDFIDRLKRVDYSSELNDELNLKLRDDFTGALEDDLNISEALSHLFDYVRDINSLLDRNAYGKESAGRSLCLLNELDSVLGVLSKGAVCIPVDVEEALKDRDRARKEKNWKLADAKRDYILSQGFVIEDSVTGPILKKR